MRTMLLLAAATLAAAGCGNPNAVPSHSDVETKAINELKSMTPEQQIERIEKGPMPASAKAAQIQKIKDKAGIK
ncbi:MAG: hypothetical protein P4L46_02115 [Fimbriimonas sp.]|nr:hypothetical protein [Fimbriimonas sp.]